MITPLVDKNNVKYYSHIEGIKIDLHIMENNITHGKIYPYTEGILVNMHIVFPCKLIINKVSYQGINYYIFYV